VLAPSTAYADPDTDRQVAQTLFDEGRALMDAGRYAEACRKLAESQRLDAAGGTLLNLALCHESEGKTATAWTELKDALGVAMRDGRMDRAEIARAHLEKIEPLLVRIMIVLPESLAARSPAPEVLLDRSRLTSAAWGTALPTDPGEHSVVVMTATTNPASEPRRWETTVAATEPGKTYRVDVPMDVPAPGPSPSPHVHEEHVRSKAFWIVLGGAAVLLATGATTGILALVDDQYVKDNCSAERNFCRIPDAEEISSRAKALAWVSTSTLALGAIATFGAFFLPRETKTSVMTASPSPRPRMPTIAVGGVGGGDGGLGSSFGAKLTIPTSVFGL